MFPPGAAFASGARSPGMKETFSETMLHKSANALYCSLLDRDDVTAGTSLCRALMDIAMIAMKQTVHSRTQQLAQMPNRFLTEVRNASRRTIAW